MQAFLETLKGMDMDGITNLIAIGDQNYELDAAHNLGSYV
jgi:hypothetical protein